MKNNIKRQRKERYKHNFTFSVLTSKKKIISETLVKEHLYMTSTRLNAKLYQNNNLNNFQELNLLKSNTKIQFVCYNLYIINGDYYGK